MRRLMASILIVLLGLGQTSAGPDTAGVFDYYVLSLSWSPSWCALQGDRDSADQCDPRHDFGFILHGLWPQHEQGWPSHCKTTRTAPTKTQTNAMADIMGSSGLAWHQWNKHGRCSGLSSTAYFDLSRVAYSQITRPEIFRQIQKTLQFPAKVVESAFLESNSNLRANMITVTCKQDHFQEVRICLTKALTPRQCGTDVIRDCTQKISFPPVR